MARQGGQLRSIGAACEDRARVWCDVMGSGSVLHSGVFSLAFIAEVCHMDQPSSRDSRTPSILVQSYQSLLSTAIAVGMSSCTCKQEFPRKTIKP